MSDPSHPVLGRAGEIVGGCELLALIGRGNQGEVWRAARRRAAPASVAVKLQPVDGDPDRARRRAVEAEVLAAIDHPGIVRVFGHGADERRSHLVMDLLEGTTLRGLLEDGPLHPLRAFQMAIQIACGLSVAHAHGVVHRDIKPENILWTPGVAKLVDWSSGKFLGHGLRESTVPERTATLAYAAPELLSDPLVTDDPRIDLYSLGLTLWELLAGAHPFRDCLRNASLLCEAHRDGVQAPLPEHFLAYVAETLAPMVAPAPGDRYDTAGLATTALLDALRRIEEDLIHGRMRCVGPLEGPPVGVDALRALFAMTRAAEAGVAARRAPVSRRAPSAPAAVAGSQEADSGEEITTPSSRQPGVVEVPTFMAAASPADGLSAVSTDGTPLVLQSLTGHGAASSAARDDGDRTSQGARTAARRTHAGRQASGAPAPARRARYPFARHRGAGGGRAVRRECGSAHGAPLAARRAPRPRARRGRAEHADRRRAGPGAAGVDAPRRRRQRDRRHVRTLAPARPERAVAAARAECHAEHRPRRRGRGDGLRSRDAAPPLWNGTDGARAAASPAASAAARHERRAPSLRRPLRRPCRRPQAPGARASLRSGPVTDPFSLSLHAGALVSARVLALRGHEAVSHCYRFDLVLDPRARRARSVALAPRPSRRARARRR